VCPGEGGKRDTRSLPDTKTRPVESYEFLALCSKPPNSPPLTLFKVCWQWWWCLLARRWIEKEEERHKMLRIAMCSVDDMAGGCFIWLAIARVRASQKKHRCIISWDHRSYAQLDGWVDCHILYARQSWSQRHQKSVIPDARAVLYSLERLLAAIFMTRAQRRKKYTACWSTRMITAVWHSFCWLSLFLPSMTEILTFVI